MLWDPRTVDDNLEEVGRDKWLKFGQQIRSTRIRDILTRKATLGVVRRWRQLVQQVENVTSGTMEAMETWAQWDEEVLSILAQVVISQRIVPTDLEDGLAIYRAIEITSGTTVLGQDDRLAICDALSELGSHQELLQTVSRLNIADFNHRQAGLLTANAFNFESGLDELFWLKSVNTVLGEDELADLVLDPNGQPVLDRLSCKAVPGSVQGPLVTVIVPTHNPGLEIFTAVRSLVLQTWRNLEILIMDDASDPEYESRIQSLENLDPRIRVIHSSPNRGSYYVRNLAVSRYAHGEFVTIHDDDDWSHADKIAFQVSYLLESGLAADTCHTIRVTNSCRFVRVAEPLVYSRMSYASLMVRRSVFRSIGYWQPLWTNADREFWLRIESWQGRRIPVLGKTPWLFQRVRENSLTFNEISRGYILSSRRWHEWLSVALHSRSQISGRRVFEGVGVSSQPSRASYALQKQLPGTIEPKIDDLVITHWGKENDMIEDAIKKVNELRTLGHVVGLMHVDSPRWGIAAGITDRVARLVEQEGIHLIAVEDELSVKTAWVLDPGGCWLAESPQPKLHAEHVICPCGNGGGQCYLRYQTETIHD
ncbi:MAG: glycosyltransferase family 2 protein [Propionibacteriaceae bacterium]|nr:glycosyltransferase family 2 protein [Propionibacteriaceae bacterium]